MNVLGKIVLFLVAIIVLLIIDELAIKCFGITYKAPNFWRGVAFKLVELLITTILIILYYLLFFRR